GEIAFAVERWSYRDLCGKAASTAPRETSCRSTVGVPTTRRNFHAWIGLSDRKGACRRRGLLDSTPYVVVKRSAPANAKGREGHAFRFDEGERRDRNSECTEDNNSTHGCSSPSFWRTGLDHERVRAHPTLTSLIVKSIFRPHARAD